MWLLVAREPRPDAAQWPGRRLLAAIDAVAWPAACALVFGLAPFSSGLMGPFVVAAACLVALARLRRALWVNHRYRFTTWRWAGIAATLVGMGLILKLTLSA